MSVTEVPLSFEEQAQQMMILIRQMARSVSGFAFVAPERKRRLTPVATVPDEFFEVTAAACDASEVLATSCHTTGAQLRGFVTFSRSFEAVAKELELTARGLRDTIAIYKGEGGRTALHVYNSAKRINRPEDKELLVPHIRQMKLALGRTRKKKEEEPKPGQPGAPAQPTNPAQPDPLATVTPKGNA